MRKPIQAVIVTVIGATLLIIAFSVSHREKQLRASVEPITIRVEYVQNTCDAFYPKMTEVVGKDGENNIYQKPILRLAIPADLKSPENSEFAYHGNIFLLNGYRYISEKSMLPLFFLIQKEPIARFDLVSWRPVPPYYVWDKSHGEAQPLLKTDSVEFATKMPKLLPRDFVMQRYNDCLGE